jgi:hypothetical protein
MSFWVGPNANENEFIDEAVLTPGGLVPDKLRADESFNLPFPIVLKSTAEIVEILLSDTTLRKSLEAYRVACEKAFENTGTGKTSTSFVVPWTAAYRISLRGEVTFPPILDEIGLRYLYKATIRDATNNAFGQLISTTGEVSGNINLYCALLEAGLPIPDPAYEGLDCGGSVETGTILAYGIPSEPFDIVATNTSTTEITLLWDPPFSTDTNREGAVTFPFMDIYSTNYISVSSKRYPNFITHIKNGVLSPNETVIIEYLNPGHIYEFTTKGKNRINPEFGSESLPGIGFTDPPARPDWLNYTDMNNLENLPSMRTPYLEEGAFTLNGSDYILNILNKNNLVGSNNIIRTVNSGFRRNNEHEGNITSDIGILTAHDYAYDIHVNTTMTGYGNIAKDNLYTDTIYPFSLVIENDKDYFFDNQNVANQGFWKAYETAIEIDGTYNNASEIISFLEIDHLVNGTLHSTGVLTYAIDNININATLSNVQINNIANDTINVEYISGVPAYVNDTVFNIQFNTLDSANYFLRHDKKHADAYLVDSFLNNISDLLEITQPLFNNNTHNYYYTISEAFGYLTSNNTVGNGTQLFGNNNSELIQFNDFNIKINSDNAFSENVSLVVRPYNLYGVGQDVISGIIDPTTGIKQGAVRLDTRSQYTKLLTSNATSIYGLHTKSGLGIYPCIQNDLCDPYDHNTDLFLDVNNSDMQLVNGTFSTPSFGDGYKDYSKYYWANSSISISDYSLINSSILYVTYKYTERINLAKGCSIRFINSYGFTEQLPEDITMNIKLAIDGESCTGWLDANKIVGPNGARNFEKDGTPCLDFDSNATIKHCYLPIGATGDLYVRLGFDINSTNRIQAMKVNNVIVNQSFILDLNDYTN